MKVMDNLLQALQCLVHFERARQVHCTGVANLVPPEAAMTVNGDGNVYRGDRLLTTRTSAFRSLMCLSDIVCSRVGHGVFQALPHAETSVMPSLS